MAMKHVPLETEIEIAANWWAVQIRSKHPEAPNIDAFERCLRDELRSRYRDHWYPHDIPRGSGFRALSYDLRMDPALAAAGAAAKIDDLEKLLTHVRDQVMFVNPGEVKIRNAALLTTSSRVIWSINPPEDESPTHTGSNSGPAGGAGSTGAAGTGSTVSASAPIFTPSGYLSSNAYAGPTFIPSSGVGVGRQGYAMSSASASSPAVGGGGGGGGLGINGDDGYDGGDYARARTLALHPGNTSSSAGMTTSGGGGGGSDLRPTAGHWVPGAPINTAGAANSGMAANGGLNGGGYQTGGNIGVPAAATGAGAGQTILAGNRVGAIAAGGGVGAASANRGRGYSSTNTGYGMNTSGANPGRR